MAAAEAAQASAGPSFAPEDPTLPKPWKGLIDGSTGVLYYWNPETNVTQYEKPAGSAPPLPTALPSSASKLNAAPSQAAQTIPLNGSLPQQHSGQQTLQQPYQLVQQQQQSQPQMPVQQSVQQIPFQQLQQLPYQQQQPMQNQQPMQTLQQPSSHYSQLQQPPYQQIPYMQGQIMPRPQGQFPYQPGQQPQAFQFPYQQGQQLPGPKFSQDSTGQQPSEPQAGYQLGQQLQGPQTSQQQSQPLPVLRDTHEQGQNTQSQHIAQQQGMQSHVPQFFRQQEMLLQGQQPSQQIGFTGLGDAGHQETKVAGLSPSMVQQPANPQSSGLPVHAQIRQSGANIFQPQVQSQLGGSAPLNHKQAGMSQSHQMTGESSRHQMQTGSSMFPNQMAQSMPQPLMGSKTGYEDDHHDRGGSEFYSSGRVEGPMMHSLQPKLAPLPIAQNKQDMRVGAIPPKFLSPGHAGGSSMRPGNAIPNTYSHATFPNASPVRPPPRKLGAPDSPNISVDAYRQRHEVTATGDNIPAPFMTFEATGFPPEILREIHAAGFLYPTPIQAQTWPVALQNRDIVAIAKTGSGKTLGYVIPALIHLSRCRNNPQFGPTVLILAPTRELATQIQEETLKFGRSSRISCTCLYGGAPKGPQLKEIERGVDIVVATPGRLNDIIEMGKINFRQISFLVLDEADRMLDMGFELQIRKIVNEIPPRRQTLMYTATWPMEVRKIAGDLLVDAVQVNIGSVDELVANKAITQYVEVVSQMDKQRRLEQILRSRERGSKVIIFCSTKKLCDQLAYSIGRPFGAIAIHGDKSQQERDNVLNQFRTGRFPILVATDVAARGLDIKDIRVVINYDFPNGIEDYVHRIGRTGRAGATGVSYTFFTDQDWKHAHELVKLLEGANQGVPPEVREMAVRSGPPPQRIPQHGGMNRWDSSGSNGGVRVDHSGGRGMREFGRGGGNGRGFGGRGGRGDFYVDGRGGNRGRGFSRGGWGGRHDRGGPRDRFQSSDGRGHYEGGRGRGGYGERIRDRSHSRSPEKSRTRKYNRSRSSSRSRSWSRSRSRSWSPRSHSRSRSPSTNRSHDRYDQPRPLPEGRRRRVSGFDVPLSQVSAGVGPQEPEAPNRISGFDAPPSSTPAAGNALPESKPQISGFDPPLAGHQMSPMSSGHANGTFTGAEIGN
ncbi:hypothetical protein M5K25_014007 [Dendrobium thyrsiflorum]|uniref:RNA helicase n=1 Tax=Dendrobium thyrsiflorum TaxID=117978 RepID=A0ABD0UUK3_DENTH